MFSWLFGWLGWFARIEAKVDRLLVALEREHTAGLQLQKESETIMATQAEIQASIDSATKQITTMTNVAQSAVAAINGIPQRIADAITAFQAANPGVDVSALNAAVQLEASNADALAAAITANTPSAPTA